MTNMTKQTEADRLANQLDYHREYDLGVTHTGIDEQAAAELRRQQAEIERLNEALAEQPAPATELREQEPVSDRENAIIRFALHQFMSNAYSNMNAAAQNKDSRHYTVSAMEKFAKDAKDAEALLNRLQFKVPQQPAQQEPVGKKTRIGLVTSAGWDSLPVGTEFYTSPQARRTWVGLTEQEAAECWSTSTVRTWQAIEAKLREKNA